MKGVHTFCYRYRNLLAGLLLPYALISLRWEWEEAWGMWLLAVFLCSAGMAIRGWAVANCNYGQGRKKLLATTGPYASVRNPLYLGNLTILAGATIASELVWLLPVCLAWAFFIYNAARKHEERRLEEKYGEAFLSYRARVPAWIPNLKLAHDPFPKVIARQAWVFLLLLPFLMKEIVVDLLPYL